jgi:hypothetical protein
LNPFSKTKLNLMITGSTCCDDDEYPHDYHDYVDRNDNRKKKYNYHFDSDLNLNLNYNNKEYDDTECLYTLIWYDCKDCKELLNCVIKNERKKILYINGGYYFFDEDDETNSPILYKNDELIATDLFSIYEELIYNKIIEE